MNIAANLDRAAFHDPDHRAVSDGDRSVSFSGFRRNVNRMGSVLVIFGIYPDDHWPKVGQNLDK
ncbi:MAG TPA: hypothetical protein G4O14_03390 [Anaerolineae bacterium]|nr:hypothetical protein [Anaerolineae bacterium]